MNTNPITQLEQFRLEVYHSFDHRADATMEVLDALTGNTSARSVVELSLAPDFRRTYSSVYAAIGACFTIAKPEHRRRREQTLLRLIAAHLTPPQPRKFWLFGMDATAIPRIFAPTLPDRGFVHCANPIGGNKPITHRPSVLAAGVLARQAAWRGPRLDRALALAADCDAGDGNPSRRGPSRHAAWRTHGCPFTTICASRSRIAATASPPS